MSSVHLFFRDYTGTIVTVLLIICCYVAIILPEEWSQWLYPFFILHGGVYKDGVFFYQKDIKDICTVISLTILLTVIRYFLCNTIFRLVARVLKIENTLEKTQVVHKTEVYHMKEFQRRNNAGSSFTTFSLFQPE